VLAELEQVRSIARTQAPVAPPADLWAGIAARIGTPAAAPVIHLDERRPARRHFSFSMPQLAAAAMLLVALSGGAVWLALDGGRSGEPATAGANRSSSPVQLVSTETAGYESAIAELQRSLRQTRTPLDSSTVAVLRQSLATIDAAIADARTALAQDPANPFLHRHLDGAMKKKVDILRTAVSARRAAS
jgi:hypothetical protein